MKSADIIDALARWHKWDPRDSVLLPNVAWGLGMHEADLVVVSKAFWLQEVEIKISMSDFRREFVHNSKGYKHMCLVQGNGLVGEKHKIKHYWIAMPEPLALKVVEKGLLPAHAGLLAVPEGVGAFKRVRVLVEAPRLKHSRALTEREYCDLMRLAYLRYWDLRGKSREKEKEAAAAA